MRRIVLTGLVGVLGCALRVGAQSPFGPESAQMHMTSDTSSSGAVMAMMNPVKGQPYTAEKVTRSVWRLGDGTTITHESTSKLARDGEGRMREDIEQTQASSVGGKLENTTIQMVTIADPTDHSLTMLDAKTKLAMKMQMPNFAGYKYT